VKKGGPVGGREVGPTGEGSVRRAYGVVDIGGFARGDLGQESTVGRVFNLDDFASMRSSPGAPNIKRYRTLPQEFL
jgi:hypothetical protein